MNAAPPPTAPQADPELTEAEIESIENYNAAWRTVRVYEASGVDFNYATAPDTKR